MQGLRDAATLVALILLALTVRVHLHGAPVDAALATPAVAATAAEAEPAATRPATGEPADAAAAPAPAGTGTILLMGRSVVAPGLTRRALVWHVEGRRVQILRTPAPPAPCPLEVDPEGSC